MGDFVIALRELPSGDRGLGAISNGSITNAIIQSLNRPSAQC
jgi:hypothetical protein